MTVRPCGGSPVLAARDHKFVNELKESDRRRLLAMQRSLSPCYEEAPLDEETLRVLEEEVRSFLSTFPKEARAEIEEVYFGNTLKKS